MKNYAIDLSNVLSLSIQHEFSEQCVNFYEYLKDEVKNLHSKERKDPVPSIIPGTYNPQNGAAYYFTPHGNQICRQPQSTIEQASKNYDNAQLWMNHVSKNSQCIISRVFLHISVVLPHPWSLLWFPHNCWWWRGEKGPFLLFVQIFARGTC